MIEIENKETKNITSALIKFHGLVGKVAKNSTNPYFKAKYGDLNAYLDVVKEPLAQCGLSIVQMPITNGLITMLLHESGETLSSEMTIPNLPADPQKVGSALTYMRRYMLSAFLGLNAEDDDGNSSKPADLTKHKENAKKVYKMIKNPSDKLNQWISQLDTYSGEEINKGLQGMQKILDGEKQ